MKKLAMEDATKPYIVAAMLLLFKAHRKFEEQQRARWPKRDNSYLLGIGDQLTLVQMMKKVQHQRYYQW